MSEQSNSRWDPWALPSLVLWIGFMLIGLLPEATFHGFRQAGYVLTQDAIVNSPYAITIAFSIYIGYFVYRWCQEAGVSRNEASAKAVQTALVGLVAFLPMPMSLIFLIGGPMNSELRLIVLTLIPIKVFCWLYLFSIPLRYYGLGNRQVCANMWCVFPSASSYRDGEDGDTAGEGHEADEDEEEQPPGVVPFEKHQDAGRG